MPKPMVRVTKQMLGNTTRKSLLYLDQGFLSLAFRATRAPWVDEAIERFHQEWQQRRP